MAWFISSQPILLLSSPSPRLRNPSCCVTNGSPWNRLSLATEVKITISNVRGKPGKQQRLRILSPSDTSAFSSSGPSLLSFAPGGHPAVYSERYIMTQEQGPQSNKESVSNAC